MISRIRPWLFSSTWILAIGISAEPIAAQASEPAQIIVPATPAPVEQHAAGELARYVKQITDVELAVVSEDVADLAVRSLVVGRTKSNLKSLRPDDWPPETIHIGYGNDHIAIVGQGPQGTLFAAYEFLRDQGCRWYLPEHLDAECIPRRASLLLAESPKRHTPSFMQRGWHGPLISTGAWLAHSRDWAVRNGLNTPALGGEMAGYGPERGHGRLIRPGHTLPTLIPSGDFEGAAEAFAAHPDWYPLVDGHRVTRYKDGRPVQACLSNPEVVEEASRKIVAFFVEHPDFVQFSIGQADEPSYWCECKACLATDGPTSTWKRNDVLDAYPLRSPNGPGPMSDRFVKFVNGVARRVAEACPGKLISFYAYGSTATPPRDDNWRLEPNVVVEFAFGDGWCLKHSLDDNRCPANAPLIASLRQWSSRGNPVLFYDYPLTAGRFDIPSGYGARYRSLIAATKRHGVGGWSGEGQCSWAGSALWQYLKARLLWDVDADVESLVAEFCADMYGDAGPSMKAFYAAFETELDALPGDVGYGRCASALTDASIDKLSELLDEATTKADGVAAARRVFMMCASVNALRLDRLGEQIKKTNTPELRQQREKLRAETLALIVKYELPVGDSWRDSLGKPE